MNLRGSKIHGRGVDIGFILDSLKLQSIQLGFGNVARLKAVPADLQRMVPVAQVLTSQLQPGLGLQGLDERTPQIEHQVALQVRLV